MPVHALIVWLVPFLLSFGFFTPGGELRTDIFLFKTVMLLVSTPLGFYLMTSHLWRLPTGPLWRGGLIAGSVWLIVNWALDLLVLLPISGMSMTEYWTQIGLRYLAMPMTGFFLGRAME